METTDRVYEFVRSNLKWCVASASLIVIIILAVYGYLYYEGRRNERLQYALSQGIAAYETYAFSGKKELLDQAEGIFIKIRNEKQGKTYPIASLYLGKISTIKGKKEEATKLYHEAMQSTSDAMLRSLAEKALASQG